MTSNIIFILAFTVFSNLVNAQVYSGVAVLFGSITDPYTKTENQISGTIVFDQTYQTTIITVNITGLIANYGNMAHGLHVHEFGITNPSFNVTERCESAGEHYNPLGMTHGGLNSKVRHIADLGNVISDNNGIIFTTIEAPTVVLSGQYSVLGRTIVLHQDRDDLGLGNAPKSKTTGNSGNRIACGVIGINKK